MNGLLQRWQGAVMPTYTEPLLALERGFGSRVWDTDGNEYVDMLGGIAVNVLGHGHPAVVEAVARQVATLGHTSNLYANTPSIELAERLLDLLQAEPAGKVFFCNSGAEANETALKIARRTGRAKIVTAIGSFHGRTMGALSLTGQPAKQEGFAPLLPGVVHVPYGDFDALSQAVDDQTAAILLEPILGEGGVVPAPDGYLVHAHSLARKAGALLMLDEVQTGIARTGHWFAHQAAGVVPDVVTLAKGLGGGLPIGACIALNSSANLLEPGQHASTFGGNPIACAAANAVLDTVMRQDLMINAKAMGTRLRDGLTDQGFGEVRGQGLMLGVVLGSSVAQEIQQELQNEGFLVGTVGPDVLRITPPLIIESCDVEAFVRACERVSKRVTS